MFRGDKINEVEQRPVLHVAARMQRDQKVEKVPDAVENVHKVLDQVKTFSEKVRSGEFKGFSGKNLKNFIVIGIGGSQLGTESMLEALREDSIAKGKSNGFELKILANVCPSDFYRSIQGLDIEETLFLVVSKSFTTAETMLNARTAKNYLFEHFNAKELSEEEKAKITGSHLVAISTNLEATKEFGVLDENVFGFWDYIGGRFSSTSAVGILPLSLFYSFEVMREVLDGLNYMDNHFREEKDLSKNLPVILGLIGFFNTYICEYNTRAILPYS